MPAGPTPVAEAALPRAFVAERAKPRGCAGFVCRVQQCMGSSGDSSRSLREEVSMSLVVVQNVAAALVAAHGRVCRWQHGHVQAHPG